MAVPNRTALIEKTYKVLKKYYKPLESTPNRNVLEHLLYALILENAPFDLADKAFERIRDVSFDWNEVRVSSVGELAELMAGIPDARQSAANLKRMLHSVFETQYSFELEQLHLIKNLRFATLRVCNYLLLVLINRHYLILVHRSIKNLLHLVFLINHQFFYQHY